MTNDEPGRSDCIRQESSIREQLKRKSMPSSSRSLLILSDIHFGSLSGHADFGISDDPPKHVLSSAVSMKTSLVELLSGRTIDCILVPGDLTSKGTPTEFSECHAVLQSIASHVDVPPENMLHTFGNHDVNWRIAELDGDPLYAKAGVLLGSVMAPPVPHDFPGPVAGCGVYHRNDCRVYALNTAIENTPSQRYQHGKLGLEQLQWLQQFPGCWNSRENERF